MSQFQVQKMNLAPVHKSNDRSAVRFSSSAEVNCLFAGRTQGLADDDRVSSSIDAVSAAMSCFEGNVMDVPIVVDEREFRSKSRTTRGSWSQLRSCAAEFCRSLCDSSLTRPLTHHLNLNTCTMLLSSTGSFHCRPERLQQQNG